MPELEKPNGTSPLSQKRVILNNTNSIPKISSLDNIENEAPPPILKSRQPMKVDLNNKIMAQDNVFKSNEKSGSSAKIVIWVVIAIVLAIAAYLGLKSFLNGPATDTTAEEIITVTPVEDYMSQIVDMMNYGDDEADYQQSLTLYNNGPQNVGTASEGSFELIDVLVKKYETFTRLAFRLNGDSESDSLPQISSEYDESNDEISVTFPNTTTMLDIKYDTEIVIDTLTVASFMRVTTDNVNVEKFVIKLNQASVYLLQIANSSDSPLVYVDIKENLEEVFVTPAVSVKLTPIPTITPTIDAEGNIFENVYSKTEQLLNNGLTTNTADLGSTYNWDDNGGEFDFRKGIILGDGNLYPKVTAKLVNNTLEVEIFNLEVKNTISNVTFPTSSVVTELAATRVGNTTKYVFSLTSQRDYRIAFDQVAKELWIQVKH